MEHFAAQTDYFAIAFVCKNIEHGFDKISLVTMTSVTPLPGDGAKKILVLYIPSCQLIMKSIEWC